MSVQIILKNSNVEDKRPLGTQLANGELSLNYAEAGAFLCCVDNAGNIQQVGGVKISDDAPADPVRGTMWINSTDNRFFVHDGATWLLVAGGGGGGGGGGGDITSVLGGDGIRTATNNGIVTVTADVDTDRGLHFVSGQIAVDIGANLSFDGQGRLQADVDALSYKGTVDLTGATVPANPSQGDVFANTAAGTISAEWSAATGEGAATAVAAGDLVAFNGTDWSYIPTGGTPGGATDLGVDDITATTLDITSSTGNDATVPSATDASAGLMTAADKAKLDDVENDAQANVQSDWLEQDQTSDAFIHNKPAIVEQVQSDWDEVDTLEPSFIQNKPDLIEEAPEDGQQYVRQDAGWTVNGGGSPGSINPPDDPIPGQLWVDINQDPPQLNVWSGTEWVPVGSSGGASPTEPVDPIDGQIWVNLAVDPPVLLIWDETNDSWIGVGIPEAPNDGEQYARQSEAWAVVAGGGGANVTVGDDPPNNPAQGDLWFDSNDLTLNVFYIDPSADEQWVQVGGGGGGGASVAIADDAPANPTPGDLWWDSVGGNLFIWYEDTDSSQWVSTGGGGGGGGDPFPPQIEVDDAAPEPTLIIGADGTVTLRAEGANQTQTLQLVATAGNGSAGNIARIIAVPQNGSNSAATDLRFLVRENNGDITERLFLANNGAVAFSGEIGTAGQVLTSQGTGNPPQWATPSAQVTGGTWTPTTADQQGAWANSGTITYANASWNRVGNQILIRCDLSLQNRITPNASGDFLRIDGLPVAAGAIYTTACCASTGAGMDGIGHGWCSSTSAALKYWSSSAGMQNATFTSFYSP